MVSSMGSNPTPALNTWNWHQATGERPIPLQRSSNCRMHLYPEHVSLRWARYDCSATRKQSTGRTCRQPEVLNTPRSWRRLRNSVGLRTGSRLTLGNSLRLGTVDSRIGPQATACYLCPTARGNELDHHPEFDCVVRRVHQILFGTQVTFSRLNRSVAEQHLNLLQFPASGAA